MNLLKKLLQKLGYIKTGPGVMKLTPDELSVLQDALDEYFANRIYAYEELDINSLVSNPNAPSLTWFFKALDAQKKLKHQLVKF